MAKKPANYAWERLSLAIWRASVWEEAAAICEFFSCLYPTLPPQQRDLLLSLQHVPKSKLCHKLGKQWLYQLFSQPKPDILEACHGKASWLRTYPDLLVRRVSLGKGSTRSHLESQLQRCVLQFTSSTAMAAPKQLVWLELGQKLLKKSGAALSIHTNLALHLWPKHWGMQPSWGPEKHRYKIRNTQTYFDNSIFFRLSSLERNKTL